MEENNDKEDFDHNKFTYFVNENPTGEWIRLPDLTLNQLNQSKNIKHILSGNLNTRLVTNPVFEGREKEFLRAQIARIVHATTVVPDGIFAVDEKNLVNKKEEEDESSKDVKTTNELNSHESWVWYRP